VKGDRLRPWVLPTAAIAVYVTAAFLTFGYGANRKCELIGEYVQIGDQTVYQSHWNEGCNAADAWAGVLFIVWPIYWAGRAAIEVTK
jgi:hypothetical protein